MTNTPNDCLIISHTSALELLRQPGMDALVAQNRCRTIDVETVDGSSLSAEAALSHSPFVRELERPLNVLMGHGAPRRSGQFVRTHTADGPLPPHGLVRLAENVYVVAPEVCLMQLASKRPKPVLIALAMEMMGTYAVAAHGGEAMYDRQPLTTPLLVLKAVRDAPSLGGARLLEDVLRYALPNSASPFETRLAELMTLPGRWGGYGLPQPLMNYEVSVPAEYEDIAGSGKVRFDLFWPDHNVALEYDGAAGHAADSQRQHDAGRRAAIAGMGVTYIGVTYKQIADVRSMDGIAALVAKALGRRLRTRAADFRRNQAELRALLSLPV